MWLEKINLGETESFSPIFLDYLSEKEQLKPFYNHPPILESFERQIAQKQFSNEKRKVLHQALTEQYQQLEQHDQLKNNLALLLKENTYTVTTGHQLNIFTGPLYFIYKIVTTINACKALSQKYPEYNFVPVYWMASEDHDFDEISYFNLYGKKYTWETDQKGAVGRMDPSGLKTILDEMPGGGNLFRDAYENNDTLAAAVTTYVNTLFGSHGLVVIDADNRSLKSQFKTILADDILNNMAHQLVQDTSKKITDLGYKVQVASREINLFFLDKGIRERLVEKDEKIQVLDNGTTFSKEEIHHLLEQEPEKFSPNVILRPLYQETILPNLAYIGGGAEVSYWLQLKAVFEHYGEAFPILMPRNFGMIVNKSVGRKLSKTGMKIQELFQDKDTLLKQYIKENSEHELHLNDEKAALNTLFSKIADQGKAIDPSLEKFIHAMGQKAVNSLGDIEKKMLKAEKRTHETRLKQIEAVLDALFPNGKLQERYDNFLNFYQNNAGFIDELLASFAPFDYRFNVLTEQNVD